MNYLSRFYTLIFVMLVCIELNCGWQWEINNTTTRLYAQLYDAVISENIERIKISIDSDIDEAQYLSLITGVIERAYFSSNQSDKETRLKIIKILIPAHLNKITHYTSRLSLENDVIEIIRLLLKNEPNATQKALKLAKKTTTRELNIILGYLDSVKNLKKLLIPALIQKI